MPPLLRRLGNDALWLLAPALCPGCDDPLENPSICYCDRCRSSLEPAPFPRELQVELASNFQREELALDAVGALYTFQPEGAVQRLIHALKYRGCFALGIAMGQELGSALKMFPEFEPVDLIVPVPLHRARRRERGYNQAEAVAAGLAAATGMEVLNDAVRRVRHTSSQTKLGAGERARNVMRAFGSATRAVRDRTVLLCDDVCTTGATLNACAGALLDAGARRVCAATIAKDVRTGACDTLPHHEYGFL